MQWCVRTGAHVIHLFWMKDTGAEEEVHSAKIFKATAKRMFYNGTKLLISKDCREKHGNKYNNCDSS